MSVSTLTSSFKQSSYIKNEIKETCHPSKRWIQVHNNVRNTKTYLSFLRFVMQAEAWIKSKLRDLKDGGNIKRCPLQDWDEAPQMLHGGLKDFENTIVQLNQVRQ